MQGVTAGVCASWLKRVILSRLQAGQGHCMRLNARLQHDMVASVVDVWDTVSALRIGE